MRTSFNEVKYQLQQANINIRVIKNHLKNWFGQTLFILKQASIKNIHEAKYLILKYLKFAVNFYF